MGDHVRLRLDPGQQSRERHHLDDAKPRREPILTIDRRDQPGVIMVALDALEESKVVLERDPRLCVKDVNLAGAFGLCDACRPRNR